MTPVSTPSNDPSGKQTPHNRLWRTAQAGQKIQIPQGIDTIILDFDHTVGLTEYLHRASFKETAWKFIEESLHPKFSGKDEAAIAGLLKENRDKFEGAWKNAGFMDAFGKPEKTSCEIVSNCLKNQFGIEADPDHIRLRRFTMIAEAKAVLNGIKPASAEFPSLVRLDDVMNAVEYAKPIHGLMDFLKEAKKRGIKIGLCTGSSEEFVAQILTNFGLDSIVPAENRIFSNHYDPKRGKPDPHPFQITFEKMGIAPELINGLPVFSRVLILEDSISGGTAALASGAHVGFSAGRAFGPDVAHIDAVFRGKLTPEETDPKTFAKETHLEKAIQYSKTCGTEFLLMSKGSGWSQLSF